MALFRVKITHWFVRVKEKKAELVVGIQSANEQSMGAFRIVIALVCVNCAALIASPLDQWHSRPSFGGIALNDIAYGAGTYVIVDVNPPRLITTKDLLNATPDSVYAASDGIYSVTFGADRFVVVGRGGLVLVSTNGFDWVQHSAPGSEQRKVIYGNERFVALSPSGVTVSTNGLSWTLATLPADIVPYDVAFGNGVFGLATGKSNYVSTDAITWEAFPSPFQYGLFTIAFGNGVFIGLGTSNGSRHNIFTSTDARNWKMRGQFDLSRPGNIACGNGYFVTAGDRARAYSRDAVSWTIVPSGIPEYGVDYVRGSFIAIGPRTISQTDPVVQLILHSPLELEMNGVSGQTYRIESTDLWSMDPIWKVQQTITLSEEQNGAILSIPGETSISQRFFRAVAGP
jgi:hypothetical protein